MLYVVEFLLFKVLFKNSDLCLPTPVDGTLFDALNTDRAQVSFAYRGVANSGCSSPLDRLFDDKYDAFAVDVLALMGYKSGTFLKLDNSLGSPNRL